MLRKLLNDPRNNSDMLISGNDDNKAHIWSIQSGKPKFSLTSHTDQVTTVGFFDSRSAYTGSMDSTLKVWDISKGNLVNTFMVGSKCLTSCTDTHQIYTGHNNGNIKAWNVTKKSNTPTIDRKVNSGPISYMMLSSDHNSIVSLSRGGEICVFELRTQTISKQISLDKISFCKHKPQFDIDREFTRIFLGDITGSAKVTHHPDIGL